LSQDNLKIFEQLFKEHFGPLTDFAQKYVYDPDEAKGVVHDVFVTVWEKFNDLPPSTNYRSYLYTSVRNRCFNVIRNKKKEVQLNTVNEETFAVNHDILEIKELAVEIELGINTLPERCREVFEKSRIEGLKYSKIAEEMNISVKTVEAQMSKALKILRTHLTEFLSLIFFILNQ